MTGLCSRILDQLQEQGSADRAAWDAKYHKSDLKHFGCAATEANAITRDAAAKGLALGDAMNLARELVAERDMGCTDRRGQTIGHAPFQRGRGALVLSFGISAADGWLGSDGWSYAGRQ